VRRADAIIVLEGGEVREVGQHDELLARPEGVYARLYALQMIEQKPADTDSLEFRSRPSGRLRLASEPVTEMPAGEEDYVGERRETRA
jgi:ABC-type glutathione transport system ATPase component